MGSLTSAAVNVLVAYSDQNQEQYTMARKHATHGLDGWIYAPDPLQEPPTEPGMTVQPPGMFDVELTTQTHRTQLSAPWNLPGFGRDLPALTDPGMCYTLTLTQPFGWEGYTFLLLGTVATASDAPQAPRFIDGLYPERLTLIAWVRQVYVEQAEAVLTATWDPQRGRVHEMVYLAGHNLFRHKHDLAEAAIQRGWTLLHSPGRGGRPAGSGKYPTAGKFLDKVEPLIRECWKHRESPRVEIIAARLDPPCHPRHLRKLVQQFWCLTWQQFLARLR